MRCARVATTFPWTKATGESLMNLSTSLNATTRMRARVLLIHHVPPATLGISATPVGKKMIYGTRESPIMSVLSA